MCWNGTNYTVHFTIVTYDTYHPIYIMFLQGNDTLDFHQLMAQGEGDGIATLNTKESGCTGIIKIINGNDYYEKIANCQMCPSMKDFKWPYWKN